MLADYLFGIFGIGVSVTLFIVGYRQTVGARKERITTANSELERILVRRIALEQFVPCVADISRLAEGKARDYRVRSTDLLSESQVLNTVYTRVVESDLIPAEQRDVILARITPAIAEAEAAPVSDEALEEVASTKARFRSTRVAMLTMATLTSIVGGIVTTIPELRTLQTNVQDLVPMIAGTAAASLATILLLYSITRLRASQEGTTNRIDELSRHVEFGEQVRSALAHLGSISEAATVGGKCDYLVERNGRKIAVEVKAWTRPVPAAVVLRVARRLKDSAASIGATEAIIVVVSASPHVRALAEAEGVQILLLKELKSYLARPAV